jgi:hypothetical protein
LLTEFPSRTGHDLPVDDHPTHSSELDGADMQPIYLGIGAVIYMMFAVWCIFAPQN